MSFDYPSYRTTLQTMLQLADSNGQVLLDSILPRVIESAELKIYRDPDLDFLVTHTNDLSQTSIAGERKVPIPPTFIVVEDVNVITPARTLPEDQGGVGVAGQRIPLLRTSISLLNQIWPQPSLTQAPAAFSTYWALLDQQEGYRVQTIHVAPTLNDVYYVEYIGTYRPLPLSATNTTTFLTLYLPDLFLAASMIFGFLYQRDFGRAADDPQAAISWQGEYDRLKAGAAVEEARKKGITPSVLAPTPKAKTAERTQP